MTVTTAGPQASPPIPAGFVALVQAGRAALDHGDVAAAREHFLAATAGFPDEAVGHNNLGGLLMGLGEHDAAAACFAEALRLAPDSPNTAFNLGLARFAGGDFAGAAEAFTTAAVIAPDDPEVLNNRGAARARLGLNDLARQDFLAALERHANFPSAVLNLCELDLADGDLAAAIGLCEAYLQHHHDLGVIRRWLELRDMARAAAGRTLQAEG